MNPERLLFFLLFAFAIATGCDKDQPAATPPPPKRLPTIEMTIADTPFRIELAVTLAARTQGLMHRTVEPDEGMLFIFPHDRIRQFWMKNCIVGLDMLFLERDGTIINIETLPPPKPGEEPAIGRSTRPARYVLELPAGRAKELGLEPDRRIDLPPAVYNILPEPETPLSLW